MPIIHYDSKDAVPADVAEHAAEVKDGENKGKWAVNLVPRKSLDTFRENNTTLANEKRDLETRVSSFIELTGYKPDEFDIEKFKADLEDLRTTKQGVTDGTLKKSGDIDAELTKRTETMRGKHEAAVLDLNQKLAAEKQAREVAEKKYDMTFIDREVANAVMSDKLGVHPTALQDIMRQAYDVFAVLKDKQLEPRGRNGEVMYGEDGSTPMTVQEWIDIEVRKRWPHYFKESKGGGSGGGDGNAAYGGMSEAEFLKLPPEERLRRANAATLRARGR